MIGAPSDSGGSRGGEKGSLPLPPTTPRKGSAFQIFFAFQSSRHHQHLEQDEELPLEPAGEEKQRLFSACSHSSSLLESVIGGLEQKLIAVAVDCFDIEREDRS